MSKTLYGRIRDTFALIEASREAASAVNSGKRPSQKSLNRLGIDPHAFDGHFPR